MRTPLQLSNATQHDMKHKILSSRVSVNSTVALQELPRPPPIYLRGRSQSRLYSNIHRNRQSPGFQTCVSLKKWPVTTFECDGQFSKEKFIEDFIGGPLYSEQATLPQLPIPTIESSIEKLISSAVPLAESESEIANFYKACNSFPKEASLLQKRLEARQKEMLNSSWLSDWWNTLAYLKFREPNVVNVSYFFQLPDDESLPCASKIPLNILRGANVLTAIAEYRKLVCSGSLPVERIGKNNTALCSVAFKYMFHSCRIPREKQDIYRLYDPSLHKHCIVAVSGQFFSLKFVDEDDNPLPLHALELGLQKCVLMANDMKNCPQLGIFTSSNRDIWSENYNKLIDVGGTDMEKALEKIESAAIMICLDDQEDITLRERANSYWHGNPKVMTNRWFDKTIQVIIDKNGKTGICGEHAMMDGMPLVGLCNHIEDRTYKSVDHNQDSNMGLVLEVENVFGTVIDKILRNEEITSRIRTAKQNFIQLVDEQDLTVLSFTRYGSHYMKNAGFSPDAYIQVAIQLASYRLLGKQIATYESSQTRAFLHGRTETTRSVSFASQNFVKIMGIRPESNFNDIQIRSEKLNLLDLACKSHVKYLRDAANALGCDRHFLGLSLLLQDGEEVPSLLKDSLFQRAKKWRLSTSTLPTCPGFGPVEEDGIGIGYHIFSDRCYFTITARKKNTFTVNAMSHLLEEALVEMQTLVDLSKHSHSRL